MDQYWLRSYWLSQVHELRVQDVWLYMDQLVQVCRFESCCMLRMGSVGMVCLNTYASVMKNLLFSGLLPQGTKMMRRVINMLNTTTAMAMAMNTIIMARWVCKMWMSMGRNTHRMTNLRRWKSSRYMYDRRAFRMELQNRMSILDSYQEASSCERWGTAGLTSVLFDWGLIIYIID